MDGRPSAVGVAGNLRESVEINERLLPLRRERLGESHPDREGWGMA